MASFVSLFESKEYRYFVFRAKYCLYNCSGLYLQLQYRNFNPIPSSIKFIPIWVQLHSIPLQYREIDILEAIGNKVGIFIKNDMVFFDNLNLLVRLCLLMDATRYFPSSLQINSKNSGWYQKLFYEEPSLVCGLCQQEQLQQYCFIRSRANFQLLPISLSIYRGQV